MSTTSTVPTTIDYKLRAAARNSVLRLLARNNLPVTLPRKKGALRPLWLAITTKKGWGLTYAVRAWVIAECLRGGMPTSPAFAKMHAYADWARLPEWIAENNGDADKVCEHLYRNILEYEFYDIAWPFGSNEIRANVAAAQSADLA